MTYYEITQKLDNLTMTPADWKWLDEYMKSPSKDISCSEWTTKYSDIVKAYQAREEAKLPICNTMFGTCRYCGFGFKCGFNGFCNKQTYT